MTRSGIEQYVQGAGAAIRPPRGTECGDGIVPAQPAVDCGLQHRAAITGTAPLAVHDAHTMQAAMTCFGQEFKNCESRFGTGHAVQVQFIATRVQASPQAAHRRFGDTIAPVGQLLAGLDLEIGGIEIERFRKHTRLVCAAQSRTRRDPRPLWRRPGLPERPHVAHGGAKQFSFVFLVHAKARGALARPPLLSSIVRPGRRARDGDGQARP